MKILFILHFPIPFPGAAWARISFFAEYFKNEGHKVSIAGAFSSKSLNRAGISRWRGIGVFNITFIVMIANVFAFLFNNVSSIISSFIIIALLRPNIVILSLPNGETAIGPYLAARLFRKKIVIDYRDEWEDFVIKKTKSTIYKRTFERLKSLMTRFYRNSDLMISVTEPLLQSLSLRGLKDVKLITNGADTNVFKPYDKFVARQILGLEKNDIIFIYNGGIGIYYRLDIVVKAFKEVVNKTQNAKLLLVGEGSETENVMTLSKEMGLQNHIFYLGSKSDKNELARILSASDVGIIPYDANPLWKNAFPAKAYEYFACGIPVVATVFKESVLGKWITENEIGLISDPENVKALSVSFENICKDHNFRINAAQRARLLIEEHFDRNKIAKKFLNLLDDI